MGHDGAERIAMAGGIYLTAWDGRDQIADPGDVP
jgi:hypothetical protein